MLVYCFCDVDLRRSDREMMEGAGRYTFDCWIIFIDEMTLYQLDRQARLSDTTSTYNNELILS